MGVGAREPVKSAPMKLLVVDTSTEWCSAALSLNGHVLARRERAEQRHSSLILPMIDALMKEAGLALRALDGLGYGAGPGSFTGLRIACAATQGLALGADLPVVGVSTLESLAEQSGGERVLTLLDARMAEVYWAAYERTGEDWRAVVEPRLALPDLVFVPEGMGWVGVGNGFTVLDAAQHAALAAGLARLEEARMPDAEAMLPLALRAFARGDGRDAAEAAPIYLRDKVALTVDERRARRPA